MFQWQDDTDILAGQQANTTQHAIPPEKTGDQNHELLRKSGVLVIFDQNNLTGSISHMFM